MVGDHIRIGSLLSQNFVSCFLFLVSCFLFLLSSFFFLLSSFFFLLFFFLLSSSFLFLVSSFFLLSIKLKTTHKFVESQVAKAVVGQTIY